MSEIKPALTAEEWRDRRTANGSTCIQVDGGSVLLSPSPPDGDMRMVVNRPEALAAFCLHEQPFGFTREMLESLRHIVTLGVDCGSFINYPGHPEDDGPDRDLAHAALDNIEALLPPEGP